MEHDSHRREPAANVLARLDKMVAAGRVSDEEAAGLRAAAAVGGLDDALDELRLKHARARVDAAVDDGRLTPDEATAILARLDEGEDPRIVHRLGRSRPPRPDG